MTRKIIIGLIRFYQKFISPRKGFTCAHRALYDGDTCSVAVIKIIETNGLKKGFGLIRSRFLECGNAALQIRNHQRADLDCLSCGDVGGCFDSAGLSGCFGGEASSSGGVGRASGSSCSLAELFFLFWAISPLNKLLVFLLLTVGGGGAGYQLYGNKIDEIGIRLVNPAIEDLDRKISIIEDSELPDYQLVLQINGTKLKSRISPNTSAKDWVYLNIPSPFNLDDLEKITVTNKQLFTRKELESVDYPFQENQQPIFEYKINRRWNIPSP